MRQHGAASDGRVSDAPACPARTRAPRDTQGPERIHGVVQVEELGTLGGLLRYLARHDIRLGVRVREGPGKGQLVWRQPNRATLQNLLKHPLYAGAYVYGRRQMDRRRYQPERPQSGRVVMSRSDWHALLPDRCPAYLSWEEYERNLARLAANQARATTLGAVRNGTALLAGLVACSRCGVRMGVHYQHSHGRPTPFTYDCVAGNNCYGAPRCQHMAGPCLDDFVSAQVLAALAPAALELSLAAAEHVEQERAAVAQLWEQRRERAAYETDRAARQYQAVEPENRLVARTLERAWEEKLQAQQTLEEEYHRFLQQQSRVLTAEERDAIRQLAADIPALWSAPTTTTADRKEILRQVVERVEVDAQGKTEQVRVCITWAGGGQSEDMLVRPIARYQERSDYARLCARVQELTAASWSLDAIAHQLDRDGYPPLRNPQRWSRASVQTLRRQLGLGTTHRRGSSREALGLDEWWARELAKRLAISHNSLIYWMEHGLVRPARSAGDCSAGSCGLMQPRWSACRHIETATSPPNIAGAGQTSTMGLTARKGRHHDRHKSSKRCYGWVLERTISWLGRARRLSKDYERLPASSEALIYVTSIRLLLARLA